MVACFKFVASLFQSTHPYGVRPVPSGPPTLTADISINAPLWSATSIHRYTSLRCLISINAPLWSATEVILEKFAHVRFQSTHPCGVRLIVKI